MSNNKHVDKGYIYIGMWMKFKSEHWSQQTIDKMIFQKQVGFDNSKVLDGSICLDSRQSLHNTADISIWNSTYKSLPPHTVTRSRK